MSSGQINFRKTDIGNAERLTHRHGKDLRYVNSFCKWYIWDGRRWCEDKKDRIYQLAKDTVRAIYKEASNADSDTRSYLAKHAIRSESRARVEAMVSLAKSEVPLLPDDIDKDIWLFNCKNGVIDLKTGKLGPHKREYMLTKLSHITYDLNAECPTWKRFLNDIFQDEKGKVKQDTIDFLQKAVGYALTGNTREQVLFFLYGTGRNGKSTFMNVIKEILGDYGKQTNAETFTIKKSDRVNNDIAALKGARLVAATESEKGARLAESLVKQLTGGEPVQARFLHQEFFEYIPQFKIFFTTNHKPIITGADEGIWRRIRLIPFTITIPEDKLDKELPAKLKHEMPGILRWMVEGCLKWQEEGLDVPQEVQEATKSYKDEMDTIGSFLQECCVIHENAKTKGADLYKTYSNWCSEEGEYELTKNKFNRKLEERGFKKKSSTGGYQYFYGIGIKDSSFNSCKGVYSGQKNNNSEINVDTIEKADNSQLKSTLQPSKKEGVPLLI
ncbi:phage/plasmid primase, P4 family [Neobacillus cucumis]|uniref:DNA primase family protein n=1 Tax=Neobacillus cucumis TaxID=1740721 RepID=UPI002041F662|nr:phage/plasmid primase, P4 family [Neobacillus cucumis]MCM3724582.1 phage/plasmid primase, P4 family [Neobacillus cucumis]